MRHLYSLLAYLLLPFVVLRLCWLGLRNPAYLHRWPERFGFIPRREEQRPIWIHAVSVGEVQAAAPLVERLLARYPNHAMVITTMTPTGADAVRQRFGQTVTHYYLPYDTAWAVSRFLQRLQPLILLVMETEIWPNLFYLAGRQRIPVILVNARMSSRSAAGYGHFPSLTRSTLRRISLIAAQSEEDARRLIDLGSDSHRTVITGNLKFDIKLPASIHEQAEALRRSLSGDRPTWIAASTHEGEETQILDAFGKLLGQIPDCLLLLAPRHPERCGQVAELCRHRGYRLVRRSTAATVKKDTAIYLIDTLGELQVHYAAADVAFVGGSLVPVGGHNMLEPAGLGVPVITGPHFFNFTEIATVLYRGGAAWIVEDSDALAGRLQLLFNDPNLRYRAGQCGREIIQSRAGAAEKLLPLLYEYIASTATKLAG